MAISLHFTNKNEYKPNQWKTTLRVNGKGRRFEIFHDSTIALPQDTRTLDFRTFTVYEGVDVSFNICLDLNKWENGEVNEDYILANEYHDQDLTPLCKKHNKDGPWGFAYIVALYPRLERDANGKVLLKVEIDGAGG